MITIKQCLKYILQVVFSLSTAVAVAQNTSPWQRLSKTDSAIAMANPSKHNHDVQQVYNVNLEAFKTIIHKNSNQRSNTTIIEIPNEKGELEQFHVKESELFHPDLQAKFPQIRTYVGFNVKNPSITVRFRISPKGIKSMRFTPSEDVTYIESLHNDTSKCIVYKEHHRNNSHNPVKCGVIDQMSNANIGSNVLMKNADDGITRVYRLAVATTGEFTDQAGGTVADAMTIIADTVLYINEIFEGDFNVSLQLIANNDTIIYTDPNTDPFTVRANYNAEIQSDLNLRIGASDYDIGHLFGAVDANGDAGAIGTVCVDGFKGRGYTSVDNFNANINGFNRLVAHEMGHQFGANHTWTHDGNEFSNVQVEPGSGSTIMSYAGTTGNTDVTGDREDYFHAVSIQQVTNYVKSTSCHTVRNNGNAVPAVSAGNDFTIPRGTPFELDGNANDPNPGDALTFCWEQIDENDARTTLPNAFNTDGVAFRSFLPSPESNRYFPEMNIIKTGATSSMWEVIPQVSRALTFRLTVRDNALNGGANNSDDMVVNVNASAGPFVITSPNTNVSWEVGTSKTITWDVAGTTANGINALNVDILLSTFSGNDDFPEVLASNVPNDGSHTITVPDFPGVFNRIMVKASDNIFFDVTDSDFTIIASQSNYCNSGSNDASEEFIKRVQLGTIDHVSGTSSGYEDFTSISTDIRIGELHNITITPEWSGSPFNEGYSVWIDFNQDGDFEDQGEQVLSKPPSQSNPISETFTIPNTAILGQTRMRVSMKYNEIPNPCETISFGEVEDYTVNIDVPLPDIIPPVISLNGAAVVILNAGDPYIEQGAVAIDNIDGDISNVIVINTNGLDTSIAGSYTISYNVTDTSGNAAIEQIRTVIVEQAGVVYCNSSSNNTSEEFIKRVQLGSIDHVSGSSSGYEDFTSISTDLRMGEPHNIIITPEWSGSSFNEGYSVWIDFNQDGDFEDQGEQILSQPPSQSSPISGIFAIPDIALLGETRMRVSMKYNEIPSPCETISFGEVEDYTVDIKEPRPDVTPPEITLNGNSMIILNVGDVYVEQGATAIDDVDGDISNSIIIDNGFLSTNVAGVYVITYNVSDSSGNNAVEQIRTVTVEQASGTYCNSGSDSAASEYIQRVQLAGIDHISGTSSGYQDFTNVITDLEKSNSYDITITRGGADFKEYYSVWIDLNQDGDFEDVGEQIYTRENTSENPVSGTFSIPQSAVLGVTRMRVALKFGALADPCDSFQYGEVEDYGVNIIDSQGTLCQTSISLFPYSESFENTLGTWAQSVNDDMDWTLRRYTTPSSSTGPSAASEGTYYLYTETSNQGEGFPYKQAVLNSPCFDLTGVFGNTATFSFEYHMYGEDIGTMQLELSEDNGASWSTIWNEAGNKGNAWLTAEVDIASFIGKEIQLRFNAVSDTGYRGDIAIDNINLNTNENSGNNCHIGDITLEIEFDNYASETSWVLKDAQGITVRSASYAGSDSNAVETVSFSNLIGTYTFTINDRFGDGICCNYGNGAYKLTGSNGTIISGGDFGASESVTFCVDPVFKNAPSDSNSILNTSDRIDITLYPNPTIGNFVNVRTRYEKVNYEIYSLLGKMIKKGRLNDRKINVSELNSGVYEIRFFIHDVGAKKTMTSRLIKQ